MLIIITNTLEKFQNRFLFIILERKYVFYCEIKHHFTSNLLDKSDFEKNSSN